MKSPDVSIITLTWNHLEDCTKPFLESIKKTDGVDYEIVFWDNGSSDGTLDWLKSQENTWSTHSKRKIKVYGSKENIGFGAGNNEAVKYATGRYILFLNNDVLFHDPAWLKTMVDYADQHPKTAVTAQLIDFNSATEFRHVMQPYMGGWCALVDHEWVKKNGAFHPDFGWAYFEDCELSRRLIHTGYTLKQVDINIQHLGSISSADQLNIPEQFKYNKSVYRNLLYKYEANGKKRITFFACGMYPFSDSDYEGKGVGGAEASLILLSRSLAKLGYVVDVYNDTEVEGNFNGVNYNNIKSFDYDDYCDYFILFRNSMVGLDNVHAGVKLFWSCDQHTTNDWEYEVEPFIDGTIAISEYHKNYLINKTCLGSKPIQVVDLGVKAEDYTQKVKKVPGKMIYCSVPRRGLEHLVQLFPLIKKRVPNATLTITSDYTLWGAQPENAEFIESFRGMDGVTFLGKVPRSELVKHQLEAEVMAYPCTYDENFCIAALECIVSGANPVTTDIGAMSTTVKNYGVVIKENPGSIRYTEQFVDGVCSILEGKRFATPDPTLFSWDTLAKKQWDAMLKKMYKDQKANYCVKCSKQFNSGYDYYKHRAIEHPLVGKTNRNYVGAPRVDVVIKTTRDVEISVNSLDVRGKELRVPQEQAGDIIRILTDAYGPGIIQRTDVVHN